MTSEELHKCFAKQTLLEIERKVNTLASVWLDWFQRHHETAPHVIRLDFLVTGKGEVFSCELTECGGATCGLEVAPRTVAVVNAAMADDFPEGFPKELPKFQVEKDMRTSRKKEVKLEAKSIELPRKPRWELAVGILAVLGFLWPRLRGRLPYSIQHLHPVLKASIVIALAALGSFQGLLRKS